MHTATDAPAAILSDRLELISLSAQALELLLAGRHAQVRALAGIEMPDTWPEAEDRRFLELRAAQMRRNPASQPWLVRAMALRRRGRPVVGSIGFHGPPGVNGLRSPGSVEVGYSVFSPYRGLGYASEALAALLAWARDEGIDHFVASVAPMNAPSLAVLRKLGFAETGRVWDEDDGEELVFELHTSARSSARSRRLYSGPSEP